METNRLEAFSDGVFAIAITLLALEIHVPAAGEGGLWSAIVRAWPQFAAYLVSFMIIGIIWVNHHGIFRYVARVDRPLLFLNLFLLLFVVLIPLATFLFADYLPEGGTNSHVAAALYSANMVFVSIGFQAMWRWVLHHSRLLRDGVDHEALRATVNRFAIGGLVYPVTIALSFVSAPLTLGVHFLVAVYYMFDQLLMRGAARESES
jgi:uncharacterized membrane protein